MSDNKYIIDKGSLTGIADAVRNKLGTGEATTDPQTGDIVYPEDKGYYLKQGKLAGFIYPNTSAAHYSQSEIMSVSHETILELCGNINPSFIKFTVLTTGEQQSPYNTVSKTLYNGVYFYSGEIANSSTLLNNVVGATKTFAYTGQGCYITGENGSYPSGGGWNSYIYSYYSFPGVLQIEFLNENKQNIEAAIDGPIAGTSRYTMEIPDGEVPTKIPFSIDDIQDKITNYFGKKGGLIYRYHINPQNNESGTAFAGSPLSEMNVLDYGVTSVSQIKFMLIHGSSSSSSFSWSPGSSQSYTIIINGKVFRGSYGEEWPNKSWDTRNSSYSLHLCASKNSTWPLGIILGTSSYYYRDDNDLAHPRIVFMVLDLEATE